MPFFRRIRCPGLRIFSPFCPWTSPNGVYKPRPLHNGHFSQITQGTQQKDQKNNWNVLFIIFFSIFRGTWNLSSNLSGICKYFYKSWNLWDITRILKFMNILSMIRILVLLLVHCTCNVFSYPDGAPERACFIMNPRHTHPATDRPVKGQMAPAPYNITISRGTFNPDVPVTGNNAFTLFVFCLFVYSKYSHKNMR